MPHYLAGGRSTATGAVADDVYANLWNPHATIRLKVYEVGICSTVATITNLALKRVTTAGTTPNNTVTPTIASSVGKTVLNPSGAVLHFGTFTTDPTPEGVHLYRWNLPAAIGAGIIFTFPVPIEVPPSGGLAVVTPVAVIGQPSDITFRWEE